MSPYPIDYEKTFTIRFTLNIIHQPRSQIRFRTNYRSNRITLWWWSLNNSRVVKSFLEISIIVTTCHLGFLWWVNSYWYFTSPLPKVTYSLHSVPTSTIKVSCHGYFDSLFIFKETNFYFFLENFYKDPFGLYRLNTPAVKVPVKQQQRKRERDIRLWSIDLSVISCS